MYLILHYSDGTCCICIATSSRIMQYSNCASVLPETKRDHFVVVVVVVVVGFLFFLFLFFSMKV